MPQQHPMRGAPGGDSCLGKQGAAAAGGVSRGETCPLCHQSGFVAEAHHPSSIYAFWGGEKPRAHFGGPCPGAPSKASSEAP